MGTMRHVKQGGRVEDCHIATYAECEPAVCPNITDKSAGGGSDRVDEFTGVRPVNDHGKEQDLRFHRRHLKPSVERVEFHALSAFSQERTDGAELSRCLAGG